MKLLVTGLNHRTAPIEVRERLAFDAAELPSALQQLRQETGVEEALILSTCNRVELVVSAPDGVEPLGEIARFLGNSRGVDPAQIRPHLFSYEAQDAVRHLFRVASSLDSMVVGEPQILGQLKAAYAIAKAEGLIGGVLEAVLSRAFNVAKRVRTETEIGQSAMSISYAAVELAREIFGSLRDRRVLIVGAGKMSELAARHLLRGGARLFVTNRTWERAQSLAETFRGQAVEYTRFPEMLPEVDILIASSGAPHFILEREQVRRALGARRNRPMFLIDIAVPRNIDPSINQLDNVFLYDIDDLGRAVAANRQTRMKEAEQAEEIVVEEVERLMARLKAREVVPTIVSLQEQLEGIRASEVARIRAKLGPLTPQQEEAIETLTRGIINKIAHGPISELRRHSTHGEGAQAVEIIRRVFRLGA